MSRSLALFGIGLVFGGGIGFVVAAGNGVTFDGHDHTDPAQHGGAATHAEAAAHDHSATVNMTPGDDAPDLDIRVIKDPVAGWNLNVLPRNFRFAPENASGQDRPGEGHAHVYVNGAKLARLYGNWLHIADLPKGEVEVKVSLNSNSHAALTIDNVPVTATQVVQVD